MTDPPPTLTTPPPAPEGGTLATLHSAVAPRSTVAPVLVPGYEILGELGRGGMGVVYKARHLALNRVVALKVILAGEHAGVVERARFRTEAEAVARLQHPGIVQVFEVGEHDGRPYLALEYVAGGSLADQLRGRPLPPREAAALAERLARAAHAAHAVHIVHRDLKPANILLAADGTPKLTDFGLAKKIDEQSHTQTGSVMGTPSYMAPEQAAGAKTIGPAVDVYALGAILYELLTGRPPFQAATAMETLRMALAEEPVPVRRLQPTTPRELETVCLKCLEKEPGRRYASALELAEDLRRFGASEPILAARSGALARAAKWVRRRPVIAGLLAAVVLVTAVGIGSFAWAYGRALRALDDARAEKRERLRKQVEQLRTAAAPAVPDLLQALESERAEALPHLRELWQQSEQAGDRAGRMRLASALLPDEPNLRDELAAWMLETDDPREMLLARNTLVHAGPDLQERLWAKANERQAPQRVRYQALVALAALAPNDVRWREASPAAVEQLLVENPLFLGVWTESLRPVADHLLSPLCEVFRGRRLPERRQVAAQVLAVYAADRPELLADLAADADTEQWAALRPPLEKHANVVAPLLERELARRSPSNAAETERIGLARRQASAATVLLDLGQERAAWPVLRQSPMPDSRSFLVRDLAPRGVPAAQVVDQLTRADDVSIRRALILALGEYEEKQIAPELRVALLPRLLDWYRHDPDTGMHSAIAWLLRHGTEGPLPRKLDWGQAKALDEIDRNCRGKPTTPGQQWYVTRTGFTMTVVPGPAEFSMGSPAGESGHRKDERLVQRKIDRSFALATTLVTVAQFKEFLQSNPPGVPADYSKEYCPEPNCPINDVCWYTAAKYCRWLSEQEKVPEEEMCYPRMSEIKAGMKLYPDLMQRTGYRLPTETEWEYACRAGAASTWSCGSAADLLPRYALFLPNSRDRMWPVGQKRPNDLGLFDMQGNAWTWCQDAYGSSGRDRGSAPMDDKEDADSVSDSQYRVLRGGSFGSNATCTRCAYRLVCVPAGRDLGSGFRIARTHR